MPEDAEVRARHMKSLYAAVEAVPGGGAEIRAIIPAEDVETVAQASGADWLPFHVNVNFTHAVHERLGGAGLEAFFREHTLRSFSGPLLGPLATALVRMIGSDPAALAGWLPRGRGFVFRGCGRWQVKEVESGRVRASLERMPPVCLDDRIWIDSVAASIAAIVDVGRVAGNVDVVSVEREAAAAILEIRWTMPSAS